MAGAFSEFYPDSLPDPDVRPGGTLDADRMTPSFWERLRMALTPPTVDESAARARAGAAGILNMGGATASAARSVGAPGAADWLESSEAGAPGAAAASSAINPGSLLGPISDAASSIYHGLTDPAAPAADAKIMTKDDYMRTHQAPRVPLSDFVQKAQSDFMASPAYKALVDSPHISAAKRQAATQQVIDQAKQTWAENQKNVEGDQAQLEQGYRDYLADKNKQLYAEHSQSFAARHPALATAMTVGGSLGAGVLSRGFLNKIASKGEGLVIGAEDALKGGNAMGFGLNANKVDQWANGWNGMRLKTKQAAAIGLPATLPLDLRGMGDAVDALAQPTKYVDASGEVQDNPSQQEAWEKISHPMNYFASNAPSLVSGLVGSGLGAKFAKAAPVEAARALLDTQGLKNKMGAFSEIRGAANAADDANTVSLGDGAFSKGIPAWSENAQTAAIAPEPMKTVSSVLDNAPPPMPPAVQPRGAPTSKQAQAAATGLMVAPGKAPKAMDAVLKQADSADLRASQAALAKEVMGVKPAGIKAGDVRAMIRNNPELATAEDVLKALTKKFLEVRKAPGSLSAALEDQFGTAEKGAKLLRRGQ